MSTKRFIIGSVIFTLGVVGISVGTLIFSGSEPASAADGDDYITGS